MINNVLDPITADGQTSPVVVSAGHHLLSVEGVFGSAELRVLWRINSAHPWIELQEDESPKIINAVFNDVMTIPGGEISLLTANSTGSTSINVIISKITA